jgi:hypothetical protein
MPFPFRSIPERIELEGGAMDMSTISKAATQASTTSDGFIFKFFLLLSILCWIVGVVDAYRVGRKKDMERRLKSEASNDNGS